MNLQNLTPEEALQLMALKPEDYQNPKTHWENMVLARKRIALLVEQQKKIDWVIESANKLLASITFRIDDPRCTLYCQVVDAIAEAERAPK